MIENQSVRFDLNCFILFIFFDWSLIHVGDFNTFLIGLGINLWCIWVFHWFWFEVLSILVINWKIIFRKCFFKPSILNQLSLSLKITSFHPLFIHIAKNLKTVAKCPLSIHPSYQNIFSFGLKSFNSYISHIPYKITILFKANNMLYMSEYHHK